MSAEKKGTVGVIGLGIMGSAMAANLVKSGFEVIGTDIAAQCRDELTNGGGTAVANAREVGRRCRHIILALASVPALHAVCGELEASCAKGTIVIETGTLPLVDKLKVRDQLAENGIILLDCTLSGTGAQAKNRDLAVYASGDACGNQGSGSGDGRLCPSLLRARRIRQRHEDEAGGQPAGGDSQRRRSRSDFARGSFRDLIRRWSSRWLPMAPGARACFRFAARRWCIGPGTRPTMKNSVWQKDMKLIGEALQATGARRRCSPRPYRSISPRPPPDTPSMTRQPSTRFWSAWRYSRRRSSRLRNRIGLADGKDFFYSFRAKQVRTPVCANYPRHAIAKEA